MLKILLCVGLVSCASASDDASLMQQGVGVTSMAVQRRFSTTELQSRIHEIGTELQNLPYPGKIRQMALDTLMKSISEADSLSADVITLLQQVVDLLGTILRDMRTTNGIVQNNWNEATSRSNNCNQYGMTKDGEWVGNVTSTRGSHTTCRGQQKLLFDIDQRECTYLENFLVGKTAAGPTCAKPTTASADNIDQWTHYLQAGFNWFETAKSDFDLLHANCSDAETAMINKFNECNGLQEAFEYNFCGWRDHRVRMCGERATCFSNFTTWNDRFITDEVPLGNKRLAEAMVIRRIICLLNALIAGDAIDSAVCPFGLNSTEQNSTYKLVQPEYETENDCDENEVAIHPGTADWVSTEYWPNIDMGMNEPKAATPVTPHKTPLSRC